MPGFYRCIPEGVAELELKDDADQKRYDRVIQEIEEKCQPALIDSTDGDLDFPNEPILCPGRRLLDDSRQTFKLFDRALAVAGIPQAPF